MMNHGQVQYSIYTIIGRALEGGGHVPLVPPGSAAYDIHCLVHDHWHGPAAMPQAIIYHWQDMAKAEYQNLTCLDQD